MNKKRHGRKKSKTKRKPNDRQQSRVDAINRKHMLNVLIFTLVALATVALALVGVFYDSHKTPAIWIMFTAVVLYALAACLYWQLQVVPESEARADAIRIKINGAFITESNKIPVFWVKYPTGNGQYAVTLVPLVFGAAITNTGHVPIQLDSLSVSVKAGFWGNWKQLTSVTTQGAEVYWANNPQQALLVKFSRIDEELDNKSLVPNVPVNGWMLFQFPPSFEFPNGKRVQWRFNAEDSQGNKYEYPLIFDEHVSNAELRPNAPSMFFDGTKDDLTVYPLAHSTPMPK
jgi:hypothetical protein